MLFSLAAGGELAEHVAPFHATRVGLIIVKLIRRSMALIEPKFHLRPDSSPGRPVPLEAYLA